MSALRLPSWALAACASSLALLSSCAAYGFVRQDVGFRHDPASDELELVVVSQGLLEHSNESAQKVAEDASGARHVILLGWPFEFDLPVFEEQLRSSEHPLAARALAFLEGIEVLESGVWGADERLSLYQRLRVPRASELLALINEMSNTEGREEKAQANYADQFGARSGELFAEHVSAGRSWAALEDGALVVRMPLSPEGAARALGELLEQSDEGLQSLAQALTAVAVEDGLATLTFAPDAHGWIRLRLKPEPEDKARPMAGAQGMALHQEPPAWVLGFLAGEGGPQPGAGAGERR